VIVTGMCRRVPPWAWQQWHACMVAMLMGGGSALALKIWRPLETTPSKRIHASPPSQVLGAASDALSAAYTAVRSELQSAALAPVKGGAPAAANPVIASTLIDAGRALVALAASSLARAQLLAESPTTGGIPPAGRLAGLEEAAQAASARAVGAARTSLGVVSAALLEAAAAAGGEGAPGQQGPLAALAADAALAAALEALSVEALAALAALRIQTGPPAAAAAADGAAEAPAAAEGDKAAAAAAKKKAKKGGAAGPALGKGTAIARAALEIVAAAAPADGIVAAGDSGSPPTVTLPLAQSGGALAGGFDVAAALARLRGAVDPRGAELARLLEELRSVVEANQVGGGPEGRRDSVGGGCATPCGDTEPRPFLVPFPRSYLGALLASAWVVVSRKGLATRASTPPPSGAPGRPPRASPPPVLGC
jgi:hypothetical protein